MYFVATELLVPASPPPHSALCEPISPPSVRLCCVKRQKRFVRRACTSLSRAKFIIMSYVYTCHRLTPSLRLFAIFGRRQMRFQRATKIRPHSLRFIPIRVCEVTSLFLYLSGIDASLCQTFRELRRNVEIVSKCDTLLYI